MPRHDRYACEFPSGGSLSTVAVAMRHTGASGSARGPDRREKKRTARHGSNAWRDPSGYPGHTLETSAEPGADPYALRRGSALGSRHVDSPGYAEVGRLRHASQHLYAAVQERS